MHACYVASVMSDSVTLWTVAHQAPLSMGFSRQEYWSALPCPYPGIECNPGIESSSLIVNQFSVLQLKNLCTIPFYYFPIANYFLFIKQGLWNMGKLILYVSLKHI